MTSRPSTAAPGGGSRVSSGAPGRPVRLQWLVGMYFVIASVVVIVPGLLITEGFLRRRLEDTRLATRTSAMRGVMDGVTARVASAERRVARFARFLSAEPADAPAELVREFDRLVGRERDGAWRSRKARFDPVHETGIFLPIYTDVTPAMKAFSIRAKRLTERFGAGTLEPTLADAWVSPVVGGQIMFVPDQPNFLWELAATENYTATDWMRLAEPSVNPTGEPRWTEPFHSVKTDAWFVSVVAPFTRAGIWGGSVGQDLGWQELVDYGVQTPLETGGRFLIIGRNGGVIMADSSTATHPSRPDGFKLPDLPDPELRDTLTRLLDASLTNGSSTPRIARTSRAYVLYATVARTGWLVVNEIPEATIGAPIDAPLRAMRLAVLLGLGGLFAASALAITREIRRRQGIEEETRRAEERFRNLFQLSPDGVGVTLLETGELVEMNDGFTAMTGYSRDELIGRSTVELGLWADPGQRDQIVATVRQAGVAHNVPAALRQKGGTVVEVEYSGRIIEFEGRVCLLSITRDVEEQRRLERQLTQAQKMEAIGRLAGGVAHDFNNIMTAVIGYAQIASETLPPEASAQDDLKEILRATGRASELTRQLLAFARRQVTQPRAVDLNVLVTETRKLLERLLGEDVKLVTDLAPALSPVRVDPGQIEQVLVNLAVNARDAMPTGGALTIRTAQRDADVLLDVQDTGTGIPVEHQPYIFEPFFTTKEHGKGTGLGLATCYGIVRQAGGRIELQSSAGAGARFRVILPALPEGTDTSHTPAHGTRLDGPVLRGGEVVLLAEDEPQVRELAVRLLTGLGYKVLVAADGLEALHLASESREPIELLLTDVVMPGLTGEELASRLKRVRPDLKVLYISGYAEDSDAIERALRNGDAFLAKPFTVGNLARRVREVLDTA